MAVAQVYAERAALSRALTFVKFSSAPCAQDDQRSRIADILVLRSQTLYLRNLVQRIEQGLWWLRNER